MNNLLLLLLGFTTTGILLSFRRLALPMLFYLRKKFRLELLIMFNFYVRVKINMTMSVDAFGLF